MLLHDARRPARVSQEGDVILLEDQDRTLWDGTRIAEGLELERKLLAKLRGGHDPLDGVLKTKLLPYQA